MSSPFLPGGLPPSLYFCLSHFSSVAQSSLTRCDPDIPYSCLDPANHIHFKHWTKGQAGIPSLTFAFIAFDEYTTLAYESLGQDTPSTPHPNTQAPHRPQPPILKKHNSEGVGRAEWVCCLGAVAPPRWAKPE